MRIAQICPYSLTVHGGVQSQVLGLARALRDLGHEARVLAPCDGPPPDPMVTVLGKSVPTAVNGSMAPIAPDPACVLRTISALRNEDFDVLHLHEPLAPGPTLTSLLVSSAPILGTFHASGTRTAYDHLPWASRKLAKRLKVRVAVSPEAKETAETTLGGRYEVLFNGIETEVYSSREPAEKLGPTLFFLGRHEHRKGLSVLLEAMNYLPSNVTLWVAGHGPQTGSFTAATAHDKRIQWLGVISESEKIERLRSTDVFCAPSIEGESFGIVLLEAMAAGAPVVASDLPGYRNVARSNSDALLTAPGDPVSLANAIERVLRDKLLSESLSANGLERAEEFSMRKLAAAYLALYDRARSEYPFVL